MVAHASVTATCACAGGPGCQGAVVVVVQIKLKTGCAEHVAARPAAAYKKLYGHLSEQADIAVEVCARAFCRTPVPAWPRSAVQGLALEMRE